MGRLNIFLLAAVVFCAIWVVDLQHSARTLFVHLGQEQKIERQIEVAFARLQLQQVTLASGERVDRVARTKLEMSPPAAGSVLFMTLDGGALHE
jgi:cell division protein FtsL